MNQLIVLFLLALAQVAHVNGECANACNGHGTCTSYDMCICYRNWMANDCSERVCQFGLAHVDTPKGDLDNDGTVQDVSAADPVVIENNFAYPYGTTEMFPRMVDSDLNIITDSAHQYMECSNKGTCDRKKGTCSCYDGYDGAACQRASCPGFPKSCSGHGVCKSIQQLAKADNENIYELWDRHATMGCECDSGYYGADCSQRYCKTGVDPLYYDDSTTIKYPTFNFATLTWSSGGGSAKTYFTDGMASKGNGAWAIRFYDSHGEDWLTEPIPAGASCAVVQAALESIPNDVIPEGTTYCTQVSGSGVDAEWAGTDNYAFDGSESDKLEIDVNKMRAYMYNLSFWETAKKWDMQANINTATDGTSGLPFPYIEKIMGKDKGVISPVAGYIYKIHFFGNPGALKEPEIEIYLDGDRPSLAAVEYRDTGNAQTDTYDTAKVLNKVWTDGMQGEDKDYFADHCDGVRVEPKVFRNIKQYTAPGAASGEAGTINAKHVDTLPGRDIYYLEVQNTDGISGSDEEIALLKACLGGSDFDTTNNVESYDWDYGTTEYPHIIKLVRSVTTITDGGHYVVLLYRNKWAVGSSGIQVSTNTNGFFEMVTPWLPTDATKWSNQYDVYTTKGTLALTSKHASAYFGYASKEIYLYNFMGNGNKTVPEDQWTKYTGSTATQFYQGSISCETENSEKYRSTVSHQPWDQVNYEKNFITFCVNKGDLIIPLSIGNESFSVPMETMKLNFNPPNLNIYTADKLFTKSSQALDSQVFPDDHRSEHDVYLESAMFKHTIKTDLSLNWASNPESDDFHIYKFFPSAESTYEYVAECSNRGLCTKDGVCSCFDGYGNDNCNEQNALAA